MINYTESNIVLSSRLNPVLENINFALCVRYVMLLFLTTGKVVTMIMTLSTVSIITTILVLYLHHKEPVSRVPAFIRFIFFEIVAKVLCLYSYVQHDQSESSDKKEKENSTTKSLVLKVNVKNVAEEENEMPTFGDLSSFLEDRRKVNKSMRQTNRFPALYSLRCQIGEVAGQLKIMTGQFNEKDDEDEIVQEWQLLATIIDRLIFFIVLACLIAFMCYLLNYTKARY